MAYADRYGMQKPVIQALTDNPPGGGGQPPVPAGVADELRAAISEMEQVRTNALAALVAAGVPAHDIRPRVQDTGRRELAARFLVKADD
jgi:hypothetical protein